MASQFPVFGSSNLVSNAADIALIVFSMILSYLTAPPECEGGLISCGQYTFNKTYCIPPHFRCDMTDDCEDKSDEAQCSKQTLFCIYIKNNYIKCRIRKKKDYLKNTLNQISMELKDTVNVVRTFCYFFVFFSVETPTLSLILIKNPSLSGLQGSPLNSNKFLYKVHFNVLGNGFQATQHENKLNFK